MSNEAKMQINFKTRSGTLINLYAQDEGELQQQLDALGKLIPEIDSTESLIAAMETVYAVMAPERGAGGGNGGGGRRFGGTSGAAPAAAAPAGEGKKCGHGDMVYRTGEGKRGKWEAYFCPAPKGAPDQCQPVWI